MSKVPRIILLSLASAVGWAAIAVIVGRPMHRVIWGGVLVAPFIGLVAGLASAVFPPTGKLFRAVFSLVSLYAAAAVFGLGMGVYDSLTSPNSGDGWQSIRGALVLQAVSATLWGITFTGHFIVLWPLAFLNHVVLARAWEDGDPEQQTAG